MNSKQHASIPKRSPVTISNVTVVDERSKPVPEVKASACRALNTRDHGRPGSSNMNGGRHANQVGQRRRTIVERPTEPAVDATQ